MIDECQLEQTSQLQSTSTYNGDTAVNAADYTIWRDTLGSTTDLRANGDASNNVIDTADFGVWKANFGEAQGAGASGEERGASVSIADELQSPPRGTDTPVRSRPHRTMHGGQECPSHDTARMLALLELLDLIPLHDEHAEFDGWIATGASSQEADRDEALADFRMGFDAVDDWL